MTFYISLFQTIANVSKLLKDLNLSLIKRSLLKKVNTIADNEFIQLNF